MNRAINKSEQLPGRDKETRLAELAGNKGGEITYIGHLAIAVPNERRWLQIYDTQGRLEQEKPLASLRLAFRGLVGRRK